ncbi:hypothetical protein HDU82_006654 [Entophlyctis luteolus]|nr:hypothetical protein HDU82_006654 [Entophlyctis luteolus]KAJ3378938.1 hypothetical protein HDU84_007160 [Entophlyctis sp. JEL0112]
MKPVQMEAVTNGVSKTLKATMGVGEAFVTFINRGNVVDLAVGVVMGAAFTAIVNSFVNDLITPVIGLIGQKNLGNLFLVIHCSSNSTMGCKTGGTGPYATISIATADGAATWNYGNFIQAVINFILIAWFMFLLVQMYSNLFLRKKPEDPKTKACASCAEECAVAAIKCKWCLTEFPPIVKEAVVAEPAPAVGIMSKMFHK